MKLLTIGLRGLAGAGKTTVAQYLTAEIGNAERCGFAFPIAAGLARMGVEKSTQPDLYRHLAQQVGAGCRAHNPDHWVKQFVHTQRTCYGHGNHCVVDDVRYPNEATVCDLLFFIYPDGFEPLDLGDRANHESEKWNRDAHEYIQMMEVAVPPRNFDNAHGPGLVIYNTYKDPKRAAKTIAENVQQHIAKLSG